MSVAGYVAVELSEKWLMRREFNEAGAPDANFVGVEQDDEGEYVLVGLKKAPEDADALPASYNGVRLRYQVFGSNSPG